MNLERMNALELRSDLHRLIDKVNDVSILQAIKVILAKELEKSVDWADTISDALGVELEESIREADEGKTISHEEAMKQIKNRCNL